MSSCLLIQSSPAFAYTILSRPWVAVHVPRLHVSEYKQIRSVSCRHEHCRQCVHNSVCVFALVPFESNSSETLSVMPRMHADDVRRSFRANVCSLLLQWGTREHFFSAAFCCRMRAGGVVHNRRVPYRALRAPQDLNALSLKQVDAFSNSFVEAMCPALP